MKKNYCSLLLIALLSLSVLACYIEVGASNAISGDILPHGMGYYPLTVYTVGEGSVPAGNQSYGYNTVVNLEAIAAEGWEFSGWSGDATGLTNTTIIMNSNKIVNASFSGNYSLTMNVYVDNTLFNTEIQSYETGYIYHGEIDPNMPPGWIYDHMEIDGIPIVTSSYDIVMDKNHTLSGYVNTTQLQLEIITAANGTTDPAYGLHTYAYGSEVNITATPAEGYSFSHWTIGADTNTSNPLPIVFTQNITITPVFTKNADPTPTPTPTPTAKPSSSGTSTTSSTTKPTTKPTANPTATPTQQPTTSPTPTTTATVTPQPVNQGTGFYIAIILAIIFILLIAVGLVKRNRKKDNNKQKSKW